MRFVLIFKDFIKVKILSYEIFSEKNAYNLTNLCDTSNIEDKVIIPVLYVIIYFQ